MFVSDFYLDLFPKQINKVRGIAIDEALKLLDKVPAHIKNALEPVAKYIGGKCMGHPAIWVVQKSLNLSHNEIRSYLSDSKMALFWSLSTSLSDDFIDKDEEVSGRHLMFFYLLLLDIVMTDDEKKKETKDFIFKNSIKVMDLFIEQNFKKLVAENRKKELFQRSREQVLRIGLFHEMIAFELLENFKFEKEFKDNIIKVAGLLGNWCALLDDCLDVEKDMHNNHYATYPIFLFLDEYPELRNDVVKKDFTKLSPYLNSDKFNNLLKNELHKELNTLYFRIKNLNSENLASDIKHALEKLEACFIPTRQTIHKDFLKYRLKQVG